MWTKALLNKNCQTGGWTFAKAFVQANSRSMGCVCAGLGWRQGEEVHYSGPWMLDIAAGKRSILSVFRTMQCRCMGRMLGQTIGGWVSTHQNGSGQVPKAQAIRPKMSLSMAVDSSPSSKFHTTYHGTIAFLSCGGGGGEEPCRGLINENSWVKNLKFQQFPALLLKLLISRSSTRLWD